MFGEVNKSCFYSAEEAADDGKSLFPSVEEGFGRESEDASGKSYEEELEFVPFCPVFVDEEESISGFLMSLCC